MSKECVAVLGTGIMGAPMARNLLGAGHPLRVWNRSPKKTDALAEAGAVVAVTPLEAVTGASVVLTMLSDGPATLEVMDDGVLAAMAEGSCWIQAATVGVPGITELALRASERAIAFVDAPVIGTRAPAEAGTLTVLAGLSADDPTLRDRCTPIFEAVGARTLWVGEVGAASRLKLVVNNWIVGLTGVLGESLALAGALEIDPKLFLEAIAGSGLDNAVAQAKGKAMLAHEYPVSFPLALARKDARLIDAAARHATLPLVITRAIEAYFATAEREGHGEADFSAIFEAIRTVRR